jgi:hypothetical protein
VISGLGTCSHIKVSNAYPSAGRIAKILEKAFGSGAIGGAAAMLMAFAMITTVVRFLTPLTIRSGFWMKAWIFWPNLFGKQRVYAPAQVRRHLDLNSNSKLEPEVMSGTRCIQARGWQILNYRHMARS